MMRRSGTMAYTTSNEKRRLHVLALGRGVSDSAWIAAKINETWVELFGHTDPDDVAGLVADGRTRIANNGGSKRRI
jgi:hypothetical protein